MCQLHCWVRDDDDALFSIPVSLNDIVFVQSRPGSISDTQLLLFDGCFWNQDLHVHTPSKAECQMINKMCQFIYCQKVQQDSLGIKFPISFKQDIDRFSSLK